MDRRDARTLSELLAPYRVAWIQNELAAVGYSAARNTINDWHNGRRRPDVNAIPYLAKVLRVDVGDLTQLIANVVAA